jgi:hypothetical protein
MIPLAIFALGACLAVGDASDQILAGDLTPAAPEWSAVAPETQLALAPAPGVQRIFHPLELRRLAQRWNLPAPPDRELCVTRPVAVPDPAELLAAMRRQLPGARIEILDYGRQPAPRGDLEFPLRASSVYWTDLCLGGPASIWQINGISMVAGGETGRAVDGAMLRIEAQADPRLHWTAVRWSIRQRTPLVQVTSRQAAWPESKIEMPLRLLIPSLLRSPSRQEAQFRAGRPAFVKEFMKEARCPRDAGAPASGCCLDLVPAHASRDPRQPGDLDPGSRLRDPPATKASQIET